MIEIVLGRNQDEINLTNITDTTDSNLFISVNGEYVGSLWVHDGSITWGAHDEVASDWIPRETIQWLAREHRHEYHGQALVHSHPHQGPHGYYEHPEDDGWPDEPARDTDVPYMDLNEGKT